MEKNKKINIINTPIYGLPCVCMIVHFVYAFIFHYFGFTSLEILSFLSSAAYLCLFLFYKKLSPLFVFTSAFVLIELYSISFTCLLKQSAGCELFSLLMTVGIFLYVHDIDHPKWYYVAFAIPTSLISLILTLFYTWTPLEVLPAPRSFYHIHQFGCTIIALSFCLYLSITIERRLKNNEKKLIEAATHDPLTGLVNRRKLWDEFRLCDKRYHESTNAYAICILDIDDFKRVNDIFGHDCGDYVLQGVCKRISSVLPEDATLGRWGGEEFIILYRNINNIIEITEEARKAVCQDVFAYKGKEITVSITLGLCTSDMSKTPQGMVIQADKYLFKGKSEGKNRLIAENYSSK